MIRISKKNKEVKISVDRRFWWYLATVIIVIIIFLFFIGKEITTSNKLISFCKEKGYDFAKMDYETKEVTCFNVYDNGHQTVEVLRPPTTHTQLEWE